jgi:hypothetical protein
MEQVQGWLRAKGNGREDEDRDDGEAGDAEGESSEVVKGLVERIGKGRRGVEEKRSEDSRRYLDEDLDLPGLDVPERKE